MMRLDEVIGLLEENTFKILSRVCELNENDVLALTEIIDEKVKLEIEKYKLENGLL